jgi:hypothetical protein
MGGGITRISGVSLGIVAAVILSVEPSFAAPATAATQNTHPINVEEYCQYNHEVGVMLYDRKDAYT